VDVDRHPGDGLCAVSQGKVVQHERRARQDVEEVGLVVPVEHQGRRVVAEDLHHLARPDVDRRFAGEADFGVHLEAVEDVGTAVLSAGLGPRRVVQALPVEHVGRRRSVAREGVGRRGREEDGGEGAHAGVWWGAVGW